MRSKGNDEHKSVFGNARGDGGTSGVSASWASANRELLHRLIDTVTSRGGAIRIGYTRDGGAYAVGFYYGSESTTKYCRPSESLEDFMIYWIEFYNELPDTGGKSPDSGR